MNAQADNRAFPRQRCLARRQRRAVACDFVRRSPPCRSNARTTAPFYLRPKTPLGDYPARITDAPHHWAGAAPSRRVHGERDGGRFGARSPTANS